MIPEDPVAAVEASIAADHAYADPSIWITRLPVEVIRARAQTLAEEGPRGRPLWGLPFAIKDNIDLAGVPTTAGCPGYAYTPQASAFAVRRLLNAGAVPIGKTNLDQFATGLAGVRSPYGTPRNPFSERHVPGGSSSGSAVAVAAGIVPFALGTDTAGSGRVPAAFGNIVGLKPTVGAVSSQGVVPACRSLDCVSVFARTVDEALTVQRVMAAYDPGDPFCQRSPPTHLRRTRLTPSLRIGVADLGSLCEAAIARCYERALDRFAETELIDLAPFLEIARLLYEGPWVAERTAGLRKVVTERPEILNPVVRSILEDGFNRKTVDAFDAFHRLAGLCRDADDLFNRVDALLLPTTPFFPTIAAVAADPIGTVARLGTFTNFVNVCGLAAFAVPAGFGSDGLPCGVSVIGPAWSEGRLAAIADMLHRAEVSSVGATQTPLPAAAGPDPLGPDEAALFCVGAHMSGLPLNGQLTSLGGRFLREAYTTIEYRLFTLGSRPALVRAQGGGAIAGEVWALPTTALGTLLSELPGPLGLGTVALQTGPCLGFLAEGAAVTEAPEITQFGGWRAYLARE